MREKRNEVWEFRAGRGDSNEEEENEEMMDDGRQKYQCNMREWDNYFAWHLTHFIQWLKIVQDFTAPGTHIIIRLMRFWMSHDFW